MRLQTKIVLWLCLMPFYALYAQENNDIELQASFFNNAVAMPISGRLGVFHAPIHPGISVGVGKRINEHVYHQLLLNLKLAYVFQQRVQHAIQLYPELGYRYQFVGGFGAETRLGIGYLHSIAALQQFELNDQGEYDAVPKWGRPGMMFAFALSLGYDMRSKFELPVRLFSAYQVWFQSPFVRSYVPLLPNTTLHLGGAVYLSSGKKESYE